MDNYKTDSYLGTLVHEKLMLLGIETPMTTQIDNSLDRRKIIENSVTSIMEALNLNLKDDSLSETPYRITKMFLDELFWGLDYKRFPKITTIENKMQYDSFLLERNIKVNSVCEHHFLPIMGKAFVAYIPNNKVIGLSKINRVVDFFCHRPQVQERLTEQIYATLCLLLNTESVAVIIKADHSCVRMRGIEDTNSDTITARIGGAFSDIALRNELYNAMKL